MLHANCLAHLPCPSLRTLRPSVPLTGRIAIAVGQPLWVRWPCSAPIRALLRRPAVPGQHARPRAAGRRRHPLPVQVQVAAGPTCLLSCGRRSCRLPIASLRRQVPASRPRLHRPAQPRSLPPDDDARRPSGEHEVSGSSTTARKDDGDAQRDELVVSKRTITAPVRRACRECRSPCPGRTSTTRVGA
jgi:hypothetical protein